MTDAGGEPRMYSSGIEDLIALEIVRALVTMDRQDSKYPLLVTVQK